MIDIPTCLVCSDQHPDSKEFLQRIMPSMKAGLITRPVAWLCESCKTTIRKLKEEQQPYLGKVLLYREIRKLVTSDTAAELIFNAVIKICPTCRDAWVDFPGGCICRVAAGGSKSNLG